VLAFGFAFPFDSFFGLTESDMNFPRLPCLIQAESQYSTPATVIEP
jgi:hypothetical protein